jgi:hypothetical protein
MNNNSTINAAAISQRVLVKSLFDLEAGGLYELHNKCDRTARIFLVVCLHAYSDTVKVYRLLWDTGDVSTWNVHRGADWIKCDNVWKLAP